MDYEKGLVVLQQLIQAKAPSRLREFSNFGMRLQENLESERKYGPDEQTSAQRFRILDELTRLSLELFNVPFSTLCDLDLSQPVPFITQIFAMVQKLEELCHAAPDDADLRMTLGQHLFFLGEPQAAREHFFRARQLKPGGRGIKRGWIMLVSLVLEDVATTRQILDEVCAQDEFDFKDKEYYIAIYDSWCTALSGEDGAWTSLINRCASGHTPPDIHSVSHVYFELATGLAATGWLGQAWQAINQGDIDSLGELYMCGLACLPMFYALQADEKYGSKLEDWFDARARRFRLHPLRELREIVEEWRYKRKHGA